MPSDLVALLSQLLVAFTIELDNEYEHQAAHRTTRRHLGAGVPRGPWLTSFAMYCNCLQALGDTPVSVGDLAKSVRAPTNLDGMRRWGYIRLSPPAAQPGSRRLNENWLLEPTFFGRLAQERWSPLPNLVEQRWHERFGTKKITTLREALLNIGRGLEVAYPDFMPILGYGLFTRGRGPRDERPIPPAADFPLSAEAPLTALLSRLLCDLANSFERESPIALALAANLLRTLDTSGIRNRDLPQLTGTSREAIAMAMGILRKARLVETNSSAGNTIRLTPGGLQAQAIALDQIAGLENHWRHRFGDHTVQALRHALESLVAGPGDQSRLLLRGIQHYPDNWRSSLPRPTTLPHFPMVLHRGGYPDGS